MPRQVPGIDLAQIMMAAQNIRAGRQRERLGQIQEKEMLRKVAQQPKLEAARLAYAKGDPTQLQTVAPQEFIQQEQLKVQDFELGRQKQINTDQELLASINTVIDKPEAYQFERSRLTNLAERGLVNLDPANFGEETPPIQTLGQMREGLTRSLVAQGQIQQEMQQNPKMSPRMIQIAGELGYGTPEKPISAAWGQQDFMEALAQERQSLEQGRATPQQQFFLGQPGAESAELSGSVLSKQVDKIDDARNAIRTIVRMREIATDEFGQENYGQFLDWPNRVGDWTVDKVIKAGFGGTLPVEAKAQIAQTARFRKVLDEFKLVRFNRMLGANQTTREMQNAARGIINANMNSIALPAAINELEMLSEIAITAAEDILLDKRITLDSDEYNKRLDETVQWVKRQRIESISNSMMEAGVAAGKGEDTVRKEITEHLYINGLIGRGQARKAGVNVNAVIR